MSPIEEALEDLDADERAVLEALAVLAAPSPISDIVRLLGDLDVRASDGRKLSTKRVERLVVELESRELGSWSYGAASLVEPVLLATARAMHAQDRFEPWLLRAAQAMPRAEKKARDVVRRRQLRDLWGALRLGDLTDLRFLGSPEGHFALAETAARIDAHELAAFPSATRAMLVVVGLDRCFERWLDPTVLVDAAADLPRGQPLDLALAHIHFARGELAEAVGLTEKHAASADAIALRAALALIDGDAERALHDFEQAARARRHGELPRRGFGTLHALASHRQGQPVHASSADPAHRDELELLLEGSRARMPVYVSTVLTDGLPWLRLLGCALAVYDDRVSTSELEAALASLKQAASGASFAQAEKEVATLQRIARGLDPLPGTMLGALRPAAPWKQKLERLRGLVTGRAPNARTASETKADRRLAYAVLAHSFGLSIEVRLQSRRGKGWSPGRKVALEKLLSDPPLPLTPEDQAVVRHLEVETHRGSYGYPETYVFFGDRVHEALALHPHVVRGDDLQTPLDVRERRPVLELTERDGCTILQLVPPCAGAVDCGGHVEVIVFDDDQRRLAEVLGDEFVFPTEARDLVRATAADLAGIVDLRADAELPDGYADRPADATLRVRLTRVGAVSLAYRVVVCPAGPAGPSYAPGEGPQRTASGGSAVRRDLAAERAAGDALLEACPSMTDTDGVADGAEAATALLAELRETDALLEWPEGAPLRYRKITRRHVRFGLGGDDDWLEVSGAIEIDEERVLEMRELLRRVRQGETYVELDDGQILVLDEDLRRQLARVAAFADEAGAAVHVSSLAVVAELDLAVDAGPAAAKRIAAARRALREPVTLPATLEAELRGYQRDGFEWLMRRAAIGLGACLADDMGLGKTVQTLALLLARAAKGPALVVAPTSVVGGWVEQALRFAPSLRLRVLEPGTPRSERAALVREAERFDVVLMSWELMRRERELLGEIVWSTVVLDEAQAIKNAKSKRAKAALELRGDARVALSGTPIENRLDELYSLFAFLQPGLLGTPAAFQRQIVGPCDAGDAAARERLRRLIEPFLLRRTKAEVLRELPARTDVELRVRPSAGQANLIEAIRREGVERVEQAGEGARFDILAALTRLRQACCHPGLIVPSTDIASAKTEAFLELVDELRASGHRALVFSQFVRHLELVRAELDARGVTYQYLDGATPAKARRDRVDAFQAGDGELFLISLKAGGTGLNLTAADYVVHLDPWWNPAVEDQASDRAHRIGQTRPVTVYRLVVEGSVEEKILALHHRKRELADAILSGLDTERLDLDTLRGLLGGDGRPSP